MISYMNRQRSLIVAVRHAQSDKMDQQSVMTRMSFYFVLWPWIRKYRKLCLHLYNHVFHITRIIQHVRATPKEDVCTAQCERNIIGHTLQKSFTWLWKIVMNASEISRLKSNDSTLQLLRVGCLLEVVAIDMLRTLLKMLSGYYLVPAMEERYRKFPRAVTKSRMTAWHIASLLMDHWLVLDGVSTHVLTSDGTQFINKFFESLCTF